jgi:hypothetical protein
MLTDLPGSSACGFPASRGRAGAAAFSQKMTRISGRAVQELACSVEMGRRRCLIPHSASDSHGIDILTNAVRVTLGPNGCNVVLDKSYGADHQGRRDAR